MLINLQPSTRMSVGLFTTITGLGRKNWRGGFSEYYSQESIQPCIVSNASGPQHPNINSSHSLESWL